MSTKRFKVGKLIRDHLPDILRKNHISIHQRVMDPDEFIEQLKEKLLEESEEVKNTRDRKELIEELADLLEVLQTLSSAAGVPMEQIEEARIEKRRVKGGFNRKIYSAYIELDERNPAIGTYFNQPEKYPQIL